MSETPNLDNLRNVRGNLSALTATVSLLAECVLRDPVDRREFIARLECLSRTHVPSGDIATEHPEGADVCFASILDYLRASSEVLGD